MNTILIALAIGLSLGWVVVGWLLQQTADSAAKLERRLDEIDRKVEKQ